MLKFIHEHIKYQFMDQLLCSTIKNNKVKTQGEFYTQIICSFR